MQIQQKHILFFILFYLLIPFQTHAQEAQKPARILFLVDASSSMLEDWNPAESRYKVGSRIISSIIDSIYKVNNEVAFAVRVFGAEHPAQEKNCYDSKLEVAWAYQNKFQIQARLAHIRPLGYSPIAWALKEAAENDFEMNDQYSYSIILVTDGGESCGGDICATFQNLISKKISFTPYILSLIDYAPLKEEYQCLGKYLQLTNEKEIQKAIQTIVDDNKAVLSVKKNFTYTPAKKTPPAVSKTPETVKLPVKEVETVVKKQEQPVPQPKEEAVKPVVVKEEEKPIVNIPSKPVEKEEPAVVPPTNIRRAQVKIEYITAITKPRKFNLLYALEDAKPRRVPSLPPLSLVIEEEKPATSTVTISKPTPTSANRPNTHPKPTPKKVEEDAPLSVTVNTEEAEQTQFQLYFVDSKGKSYNTEVNFKLSNKKNNTSQSLFRTMNGNQPQPIKIEEGVYDITVPGSKAAALNVTMLPNKINKIYIEVATASIGFYHPTAPNKKIEGYTALVSQRFVKGSPVIKQDCGTELYYEPSNYHIEINTLPPLAYNVYLNFGEKKLITIPEAGTVQITNSEKLGQVQFWYLLGEKYEPFLNMDINGNTQFQKADFLPGKYQVRYYKKDAGPNGKAESVAFSILSNQTTSIFLAP